MTAGHKTQRLNSLPTMLNNQCSTESVAKAPTECWAMDFVSDTLVNQKNIRILAVIDVFT